VSFDSIFTSNFEQMKIIKCIFFVATAERRGRG
jgi:hypothetical protein